jgi:hypothetical protein
MFIEPLPSSWSICHIIIIIISVVEVWRFFQCKSILKLDLFRDFLHSLQENSRTVPENNCLNSDCSVSKVQVFDFWQGQAFSPPRSNHIWGPPRLLSYSLDTGNVFPETQWQKREANKSSPSTTEVRTYRPNFTFYLQWFNSYCLQIGNISRACYVVTFRYSREITSQFFYF